MPASIVIAGKPVPLDTRELDLGERRASEADVCAMPLGSLAKLPALPALVAPHNQLDDLDGIAEQTQLRELDVHDNRITQLDPLRPLRRLRRLVVSGNRIAHLAHLEALSRLQELTLEGRAAKTITDASAAALRKRKGLRLYTGRLGGPKPVLPFVAKLALA